MVNGTDEGLKGRSPDTVVAVEGFTRLRHRDKTFSETFWVG